ncbi:MAG: hypothetical protein U5K32_00070 [Bacteroidales bacterium]|nr:hypothetical protein [Bacteroidales bacterium]
MIRFLKNKEIDRNRWDGLVMSEDHPVPYSFSWYLDIMSPGWSALVLDDYDFILPLPVRKKYGIKYLAMPAFTQRIGIIPAVGSDSGIKSQFYGFLQNSYRFIDLCISEKAINTRFSVKPKNNFYIPLNRQYKEIWEDYSSSCRRNIRIGREERRRVSEDIDPDSVMDLFRTGVGSKISGISSKDCNKLERLMEYCTDQGTGKIFGIYHGGQLAHAVFAIDYAERITLLLTATSQYSRDSKAGYLVTDHIIYKYSGKGYVLDFAGSSIASIATYNKSYGSVMENYYRIYLNNLAWPVRKLKADKI